MPESKPIKVIVILGPTSSGKSGLAIRLARKFKGEIISADSRQIYKDMNLGTGKVEGQWKDNVYISEGIPHHLIDFVSPKKEYNVAHFKKDCLRLIREISERGNLPIICGGTGFWISAVVDNLELPEVKPDQTLRKKLADKTAAELYEILKKLDSERAKNIDSKNPVRLIRAIEIAKALGQVPKLKKSKASANLKFLQIGLDQPKEVLDKKIRTRLGERFSEGMVKEVENLKKKYKLSLKKIQSFGLAYFWIPLFLQGQITEDEMKEHVFLAERNYAKRQRTWFKRDKRIVWEDDYKKIILLVNSFLKKNS